MIKHRNPTNCPLLKVLPSDLGWQSGWDSWRSKGSTRRPSRPLSMTESGVAPQVSSGFARARFDSGGRRNPSHQVRCPRFSRAQYESFTSDVDSSCPRAESLHRGPEAGHQGPSLCLSWQKLPGAPPVKDYDLKTQLRHEAEVLGFLISTHPLTPYEPKLRGLQ